MFVPVSHAYPAQNALPEKSSSKLESKTGDGAAAPAPIIESDPVEPAYKIGIDDTLHLSVWKESELTVTVAVRPDGMISMPLLDDVQAAGLTPMQLSSILTGKLKKYLAAPRVTVVVTQRKLPQIYVIGEVIRHGPIPMSPSMTVLQAIATAGFTQFANTKGIYILRIENGQQQKMPFKYKLALKGESLAQNILLKPGDTIVVP